MVRNAAQLCVPQYIQIASFNYSTVYAGMGSMDSTLVPWA